MTHHYLQEFILATAVDPLYLLPEKITTFTVILSGLVRQECHTLPYFAASRPTQSMVAH